tara:strand:+ start:404 stop:880 length:477 start_codon:yes stop_codon:yes gene_type:complete
MKIINKKENIFFLLLFIFSLFLSHLNIFDFANQNTNPEYFIILITIMINSKSTNISLIRVFIMGLIIDFFIGVILGQYSFTLLIMLVFHKVYNHYFSVISEEHKGILQFFTILIGIICINLVAISNLDQGFDFINILLVLIFTFLALQIFQFLKKIFF